MNKNEGLKKDLFCQKSEQNKRLKGEGNERGKLREGERKMRWRERERSNKKLHLN